MIYPHHYQHLVRHMSGAVGTFLGVDFPLREKNLLDHSCRLLAFPESILAVSSLHCGDVSPWNDLCSLPPHKVRISDCFATFCRLLGHGIRDHSA